MYVCVLGIYTYIYTIQVGVGYLHNYNHLGRYLQGVDTHVPTYLSTYHSGRLTGPLLVGKMDDLATSVGREKGRCSFRSISRDYLGMYTLWIRLQEYLSR